MGQSERNGSETEKALQKKTEELLTSTTKLTEVNELLESFKEVKNTQEQQINAMREENEKASIDYKKITQIKESLEKEVSALRDASKNSSTEVKRLSGCLSSKDIEMESLKTDLASLSSQLQQLKEVIHQQEIDQQEKEIKLLGGHKRGIEDLEDKLKKAETAKEKLEKSKEKAIQALKDKVKTLQESHGEEIQNLKTDQAKYLSETEMLRGKLQSLEALTSSKANQSVQIIEEINASKAKAIEDLNLARVQLETMSKNMENVENDLE